MSQRQKKIRFKLRYLNLRIIIHKAGSKQISNVQKKKKKNDSACKYNHSSGKFTHAFVLVSKL